MELCIKTPFTQYLITTKCMTVYYKLIYFICQSIDLNDLMRLQNSSTNQRLLFN